MFDLDLTPEQRLEEYHILRVQVSRLKRSAFHSAIALNWNSTRDTLELVSLYNRRRKALRRQMVSDCYRCYGTGTPMALQMDLDLYSSYCEKCGRNNKN